MKIKCKLFLLVKSIKIKVEVNYIHDTPMHRKLSTTQRHEGMQATIIMHIMVNGIFVHVDWEHGWNMEVIMEAMTFWNPLEGEMVLEKMMAVRSLADEEADLK